MIGRIEFVNHVTGIFAVQVEDGCYAVIELLDTCEIHKGDIVSGNLHFIGNTTINNLTRSLAMKVYIEDVYSSQNNARAMVLR